MQKLPFAKWGELALTEIQPQGWLKGYLEIQSQGLTGHPAASRAPYGIKHWGAPEDPTGALDREWWPYEQTAYWLDGALKCGLLIGDTALSGRALDEINYAIDHAAQDGFIGPDSMRETTHWPHTVFFRAVIAQYQATGDRRYLEALRRHYLSVPPPMKWHRDVTHVEILLFLYQELGDKHFLKKAEDLYNSFNEKFPNHDCTVENLLSERVSSEHGVTFNEFSKLGAILFAATGQTRYLEAARNAYRKVDRDQRLADGLHSSTEGLRGNSALESHETCDITDYTWSLGYLLQVTGDAAYADRIEQVMANAAPGAVTKDFKALQYFSCPNQVIADEYSNHNLFMRGFNWMTYRADTEVQCCPGNLHRAMPNFAARMWLGEAGGGLTAAFYGPCRLTTHVGKENTACTIQEETRYPFGDTIEFSLQLDSPTRFAINLRIPGWCHRPQLLVNGKAAAQKLEPGQFVRLEQTWASGDKLSLSLPFELRLEHWPDDGVSLLYGPLVFALPVQANVTIEVENSSERQRRDVYGPLYSPHDVLGLADFPALNLTPRSRWNYALCLNEESLAAAVQVNWAVDGGYPLDAEQPPVTLRVPVRRVRNWRLRRTRQVVQECGWVVDGKWHFGLRTLHGSFVQTPPLPAPAGLKARLSDQEEWVTLIPYGCTLLRLTVFPQG